MWKGIVGQKWIWRHDWSMGKEHTRNSCCWVFTLPFFMVYLRSYFLRERGTTHGLIKTWRLEAVFFHFHIPITIPCGGKVLHWVLTIERTSTFMINVCLIKNNLACTTMTFNNLEASAVFWFLSEVEFLWWKTIVESHMGSVDLTFSWYMYPRQTALLAA